MTSLRLLALATLVACASLGFGAPGAAAPAPGAAPGATQANTLRIVVHVPLALNDHRVIRPELRADYVRSLESLGPVVEHVGRGSWVGPDKRVVFDPVDHVVVTTSSPHAEAVVHALLVRMREGLRQQATLAEVVPDPGTWDGEQHRVQFEVRTPSRDGACDATCTSLYRVLDDAGGGASEYDDNAGAHVSSSVPADRAPRVRTALRHLHVLFTQRASGFVLVTGA